MRPPGQRRSPPRLTPERWLEMSYLLFYFFLRNPFSLGSGQSGGLPGVAAGLGVREMGRGMGLFILCLADVERQAMVGQHSSLI